VELNVLQESISTIAMAKVSTSGYEALTPDFTTQRYYCVNKDRQIAEAKKHALLMVKLVIHNQFTERM
jgi:3-hydroxyacyl-CoA dehydrogenase